MNVVARVQTFACPCCGGFIGEAAPIDEILDGMHGGFIRVIFEVLARRPGRHVSRSAILDAMYGHLPDGGPDSAEAAVNVHIYRLRKSIAPYGWSVICSGRSGAGSSDGGTYRLIPTEASA